MRFKKVITFVGIVIMVFSIGISADAAWYDFASQEGEPEVTDLAIGKYDLEDLPDILILQRNDLEGNVLEIKGRAEIDEGSIGAVMISFDGGKTWEKAEVDAAGSFIFNFTPEMEKEYTLFVKAVSTAGQASDYESDSFQFIVKRITAGEVCFLICLIII